MVNKDDIIHMDYTSENHPRVFTADCYYYEETVRELGNIRQTTTTVLCFIVPGANMVAILNLSLNKSVLFWYVAVTHAMRLLK